MYNVTLKLEIHRETELAVMVKNEKDQAVWLPKSQIEIWEEAGEIEMPEWLATDKELV